MFKRVEASAKNTEEAIAAALAKLGCARADAVIEELVKPKAGFFGIGSVEARVAVTYTLKPAECGREFLSGVLSRMGIQAEIEARTGEEGAVELAVRGENMGVVIGRRGDTLDALQYITSIVVNRGREDHVKVTVDTENYRKKREESLENLAKKVAARVLKYKRSVTLEPMSAYERRIIHSTLQGVRGISTFSTGSDPNRRVVVALAGGAKPPRGGPRTGGPRQAFPEETQV